MDSNNIADILRDALAFTKSCWPLALILLAASTMFEVTADYETQDATQIAMALTFAMDLLATFWCVRNLHGKNLLRTALPRGRTLIAFAPAALFLIVPYAFSMLTTVEILFTDPSPPTAVVILLFIALVLAGIFYMVSSLALTPWIVARAIGNSMSAKRSFELMAGHKLDMFLGTIVLALMFGFPSWAAAWLLPAPAAIPVGSVLGAAGAICFAALRHMYYNRVSVHDHDMNEAAPA